MPVQSETPAGSVLGRGFYIWWGLAEAALISGFLVALWWFVQHQPSDTGLMVAVIVFTSIQIPLCIVPYMLKVRAGVEQPMRQPYRRYAMRFAPAMAAYVVLLMAAILYWQAYEPTGVIAWLVALAPALAVLLAVRAVALLHKEETDEYWKARHTYATVWATNATLAICTVWGFLDMFGVVPHVELWAVFPIWAVASAVGQVFAKRSFG